MVHSYLCLLKLLISYDLNYTVMISLLSIFVCAVVFFIKSLLEFSRANKLIQKPEE